jgi:hypothetical protein
MVFIVLAILITVVMTIYLVIEYVTERRTMKQALRKRRDAMVEDLISRAFSEQIHLNECGLETRKALIRASFGMSRHTESPDPQSRMDSESSPE